MLNFIVLGYVPGTSVQLSFADYALIVGGFAGVPAFYWYYLAGNTRRRARQIAAIHLISL